jgi:hypothetical protein
LFCSIFFEAEIKECRMRKIRTGILFVAVFLTMISAVVPVAQAQAARSVININRSGVAIEGYDPVAYHLLQRPVQGDPAFSFRWMEATWLFANADHRDRFAQDPERYAPRFGGYCSWAVSRGTTAAIDPNAWHIENGLLYLNLNPRLNRDFIANIADNIRRAEANWPGIRDRLSNK